MPKLDYISFGIKTDTGITREYNEDAAAVIASSDPAIRERKGILLVVADGVGGLEAGDEASQLTVEALHQHYEEANQAYSAPQRLHDAIQYAHRSIRERNNERQSGVMGSTVVAGLLLKQKLYLAHVGDSRAYLLEPARRGTSHLRQLTRDHTVINQDDIEGNRRHHPLGNVITRALGAAEQVLIDQQEVELAPGSVLLFCSDGLTDLLNDSQIHTLLQKPPEDAAEILVTQANEAGGIDNISVIVAKIGSTRRRLPLFGILAALLLLVSIFVALMTNYVWAGNSLPKAPILPLESSPGTERSAWLRTLGWGNDEAQALITYLDRYPQEGDAITTDSGPYRLFPHRVLLLIEGKEPPQCGDVWQGYLIQCDTHHWLPTESLPSDSLWSMIGEMRKEGEIVPLRVAHCSLDKSVCYPIQPDSPVVPPYTLYFDVDNPRLWIFRSEGPSRLLATAKQNKCDHLSVSVTQGMSSPRVSHSFCHAHGDNYYRLVSLGQ